MSVLINPDEGVAQRVRSQLQDNPYHALRFISWDYRDGVLTLSGRLPTYHLKQMAQAAVASVEGVERVQNRIEVVSAPSEAAAV
jgi:osmotically-inducible protein OsmY